jgi:serine/threonine protein phosphatase PrpC
MDIVSKTKARAHNNEDFIYSRRYGDDAVVVVGDFAQTSYTGVDTLATSFLNEIVEGIKFNNVEAAVLLVQIVAEFNNRLLSHKKAYGLDFQCCAIFGILKNDVLSFLPVGDCRIAIERENSLYLYNDTVWREEFGNPLPPIVTVGMKVRIGPEDPPNLALGVNALNFATSHVRNLTLKSDDTAILYSDGVDKVISPVQLLGLINHTEKRDRENLAEKILQEVARGNALDDRSIILIFGPYFSGEEKEIKEGILEPAKKELLTAGKNALDSIEKAGTAALSKAEEMRDVMNDKLRILSESVEGLKGFETRFTDLDKKFTEIQNGLHNISSDNSLKELWSKSLQETKDELTNIKTALDNIPGRELLSNSLQEAKDELTNIKTTLDNIPGRELLSNSLQETKDQLTNIKTTLDNIPGTEYYKEALDEIQETNKQIILSLNASGNPGSQSDDLTQELKKITDLISDLPAIGSFPHPDQLLEKLESFNQESSVLALHRRFDVLMESLKDRHSGIDDTGKHLESDEPLASVGETKKENSKVRSLQDLQERGREGIIVISAGKYELKDECHVFTAGNPDTEDKKSHGFYFDREAPPGLLTAFHLFLRSSDKIDAHQYEDDNQLIDSIEKRKSEFLGIYGNMSFLDAKKEHWLIRDKFSSSGEKTQSAYRSLTEAEKKLAKNVFDKIIPAPDSTNGSVNEKEDTWLEFFKKHREKLAIGAVLIFFSLVVLLIYYGVTLRPISTYIGNVTSTGANTNTNTSPESPSTKSSGSPGVEHLKIGGDGWTIYFVTESRVNTNYRIVRDKALPPEFGNVRTWSNAETFIKQSGVFIGSEDGKSSDILNGYIFHTVDEEDVKDSQGDNICKNYLKRNKNVISMEELKKVNPRLVCGELVFGDRLLLPNAQESGRTSIPANKSPARGSVKK